MGRFRTAVGCLVLAAGVVSASARESVGVRGRALDGGENKKNAPRVAVDNPGPGSANDIVGGSRDDGNRHDGNTDEQAIRIERAEPGKASRIDEGGDDENNAGGDHGVQHTDQQGGNPDIASHHVANGGGEHGSGQHVNQQSGEHDLAGGHHGGDDQNNRAQHPGGHRHFGDDPHDGLANGSWNTPEHHGFDKQHGNQHKSDLDGERHDDEPVGTPGDGHANRNVDQDTGEGADHHGGNDPRNRGGERSADGDDVVDVEAAPHAALSKALSDAYSARAAAARGAAGEIFLFLAGGIFGGILAAMFANWARMVKGNEETGSEDSAGTSSPTVVAGKHESWRKKDRGILPHGEMSDVPLELPLDGTALVPVVPSEAPASGNSTAVHKHESWQKRDRGAPHGDFAMSDVPLELPLDGTIVGPVVLSEAPPASGGSTTATAVRKHEGWRRRDRTGAVATEEEDPFNFGVAGNLVPVENHERKGRGLPHHPNSLSLT